MCVFSLTSLKLYLHFNVLKQNNDPSHGKLYNLFLNQLEFNNLGYLLE